MRRLYSLRDEHGAVICAKCTIADRPASRLRGLLGRDGLAPDEGLLLTPESSVHTFFMRFPIDVVFLDADLTVLGMRENLHPWRTAGHRGSRAILELPAGACEERRLHPGNRLTMDDCVVDETRVLLLLRQGEDSQVVYGRGSLSAATRTISAMSELDVGVSAVLLPDAERKVG